MPQTARPILVDARMVGPVGHGIGNYVLDLAAALQTRPVGRRLHFLLSPDCPAHSPLRVFAHTISPTPFLHPLEAWRLPAEVRRLEPALFHSPSFMSLARYPCPHMQTVHDLNHLHFGGLTKRLYYRFLLLPSLRDARAVLAVSESGRAELSAWLSSHGIKRALGLAPNAIPSPVPPDRSVLKRLGLEEGAYFFCLSNPKPHKNVAMLEAAHGAAGPRALPLVLNTPGESRAKLIRTGALTAAEISALYAGAHTYFFPSLYEGFGRSPLEALLAGTKPVASDIPSHRETLQGIPEAELLPPDRAERWTEAFLRLSAAPKPAVAAASREEIRGRYSLEKLGDQLERAYEGAL